MEETGRRSRYLTRAGRYIQGMRKKPTIVNVERGGVSGSKSCSNLITKFMDETSDFIKYFLLSS